jgi:ribonuclease R
LPNKIKQDQSKPDKANYRSADKTGVPVPSRSLIIKALSDHGAPMAVDDLFEDLSISKEETPGFESRLNRMAGGGMLLRDRRDRLSLPEKMDMVLGRVLGHAQGFGFVIPDDGSDDLYLHPRQMQKVLHNDKVLAVVRRIDSRGRKEGAIVEAIIDPDKEIIGRYYKDAGAHFVKPDDVRETQEIVIPANATLNAKNGEVVVVKITQHPIEHRHVVGEVIELVGNEFEPGMETDIAIRKHELPNKFGDVIEQELEKMGVSLTSVKADVNTNGARTDIRQLPLVTIDGADARDFDDAVFAEKTKSGWRLIVAIADVSHYIKPGMALDTEAYDRGNSVYFPNRVIPMLPEALSNGICSLKPDEDRNCMVCDIHYSPEGEVQQYQFYPAVMFSHGRLTYDEMSQIVVERDEQAREKRGDLCKSLDQLYAFYETMQGQRQTRGTIDFDFPEPLFVFNEDQKIEKVVERDRNPAHRIIEECMLAANVCAAKFIDKNCKAGIYRNHEGPDEEALTDLRAFLSGFGIQLNGGDEPGAEHYAEVLKAIEGQADLAPLIQVVLLRSFKQAVYGSESAGHFALNYPQYTHFTSPIRRYPDLIVHRLIRSVLNQGATEHFGPKGKSLSQMGEHCSRTERRADEATRDVSDWLKAEFMQAYIGEEFSGKISGVKEFGLFVQLDKVFVDGLIHVTQLGSDYFHFDPNRFQMTGERTGKRFRLGDKLSVKVVSADPQSGKIDFALAGEEGGALGRRDGRRPKKSHNKSSGSAKNRGDKTTESKDDKSPWGKNRSKNKGDSKSKGKPKGDSKTSPNEDSNETPKKKHKLKIRGKAKTGLATPKKTKNSRRARKK